jgi:phosphoglycolate phosphatase
MTNQSKKKWKNGIKIGGLILAIALIVVVCLFLVPYLNHIRELNGEELDAALESVNSYLKHFGILRYIAMIGLQILQMCFAIIPGAPVAVMMGFMFGTIGGTLLTTLATALGTALIVGCVNHFGIRLVNRFVHSENFKKWKVLQTTTRRDMLLFFLFLIPGTPKDLLTFLAPFTGAKFRTIVVITSLARIPSIFLMVYLGDNLSKGNLGTSIIVISIAAVIGILGILVKDKLFPKRKEEKNMKKKNTVIFDLDGTLLDTLQDLTLATNFALEQSGFLPRTTEEVRSFVGDGIRKLVERAVPKGSSFQQVEKVYSDFITYYGEHCLDNTHPYAGIPELLQSLHQKGYHLAVVSNKADFAVKELVHSFFPDTIDCAVGMTDTDKKKPAPDSLWKVMENLQVSSEQTVYVGDSDVDIQTAFNAEVDCISVTWGFRSRRFLALAGAVCLVNQPDEIEKLLNSEEIKM